MDRIVRVPWGWWATETSPLQGRHMEGCQNVSFSAWAERRRRETKSFSFTPSKNGFEPQQCYKAWYDWAKWRSVKRYILLRGGWNGGGCGKASLVEDEHDGGPRKRSNDLKKLSLTPRTAFFRVTRSQALVPLVGIKLFERSHEGFVPFRCVTRSLFPQWTPMRPFAIIYGTTTT